MQPGNEPLETRLEAALPQFSFRSISIVEVESALSFLEKNGESALWIKDISKARTQWLFACADLRVSLAIDCFDCGLLLRTDAVKEKQYLRQKRLTNQVL